jgi:hypothetical protein
MKQYEFEAINRKRGNVERIRATAKTEAIARAHIVNYYGAQFDVMESCCDVNPPHHIIGEIDCSSDESEKFGLFLLAQYNADCN